MASVVSRVRFHCKIESQQMSDRSVPTKLLESIENSLKEKTQYQINAQFLDAPVFTFTIKYFAIYWQREFDFFSDRNNTLFFFCFFLVPTTWSYNLLDTSESLLETTTSTITTNGKMRCPHSCDSYILALKTE